MTDPKVLINVGYVLLDNSRQFHAAHLVTENLVYHKQLKEIYEGLDSDGDSLVEAVSGSYGKFPPAQWSGIGIPANPSVAVSTLRVLLKTVNSVQCEDRGVNAVLDNIASHLDSWIFLLVQCEDAKAPEENPEAPVPPPNPSASEMDRGFVPIPTEQPQPPKERKSMFPMR